MATRTNPTADGFVLDCVSGQLLKDGAPVSIGPKAYQLLTFFVRRPNKLASSAEILERLWPDSYVTKGLVREYVHDIRRVLNDDPKAPNYIETVHGRGYRYIGDISIVDDKQAPFNTKTPKLAHPVVAVLPLKNLSDQTTWDYFAAGITDDIITDLTRFSDLAVIANNSTSKYKNQNVDMHVIRNELGVDYALEGSIQVYGGQIRITAQLIDTQTASHVWADKYDKNSEALFDIKDDIVQQVSAAIGGFAGVISRIERNKTHRKSPQSLKVYEMYLQAFEQSEKMTLQGNQKAMKLLAKALKMDPTFARLWVIQSWAYFNAVQFGCADEPEKTIEKEHQCIIKAAELDPQDPLILKELGVLLAQQGDYANAIKHLEHAVYLGQNYADVLAHSSRFFIELCDDEQRAQNMLDKAYQLNPVVPEWYYIFQLRIAYFSGQFEKVVDVAAKSQSHYPQVLYLTACSLAQLNQQAQATEKRLQFERLYPDFDFKREVNQLVLIRKKSIDLYWEGLKKAGFSVT